MGTDGYQWRDGGRRFPWLALALGGLLAAGPRAASGAAAARETMSLQEMSRSCGFQSLTVRGNSAVVLARFHSLEVERDSRRAVFDGITVWLNGPVEKSWGRLVIRREDVRKTVVPLMKPAGALAAAGFGVVVLDAGHGGDDRGAAIPRLGVPEKQLTLEVVNSVRSILARYQVAVCLTRADDRAVSLEDRARRAGSVKADLFVSVHFNAAANSKPSGIETYILAPAGFPSTADAATAGRDKGSFPGNRFDTANMVLGYTLHKSLLKYTKGEDRGLRRARFVVIRDAPCPAALVECGFMSNPADQQKLMTPAHRNAIARGLAEGILAYLNAVKRAHNLNP